LLLTLIHIISFCCAIETGIENSVISPVYWYRNNLIYSQKQNMMYRNANCKDKCVNSICEIDLSMKLILNTNIDDYLLNLEA